MGLAFSSSNVTKGVKEQAEGGTKEVYKYMNLVGGGLLVDLMKTAAKSKNYKEVRRDLLAVNPH